MKLSELKEGDIVIHHSGGPYGRDTVEKVQRTTNTQIIVRGNRYKKSDGRMVGDSGFHVRSIHIPRDGEIEKIRQNETIQKAFRTMQECRSIEYEMAVEILAVFEKYEN